MSCLLFSLYSRSLSSLVALLSHVVSLVLSLFTFSLFSRRPPLTCRVSCSLFIHVLSLLSSPSSHMSCLLFSLYSRSSSSLVALLSHVVSLVLSLFTFSLFSRRPPLTCRVSCSLSIHVLSLLSSPSSHMSCLLFSLHSRSSSSLVALLSHVVSLVLSSFTFFLFSRRPPLTCRVSCSLFIHVLPLLSSPSSHMSCLLFSLHSRSSSSLVALLSHVVSLVLSLFTFFLFSRRPPLTCRVSCSLFIHVLPLLSSPSSHMSCLLFSLHSRSPSSLVALLSHVVSLVLSLFTFFLFSRRPPLTCRVSCSLFIHVLPLLSSPSSHMSCLLFSLHSRSPASLVALLSHVVSLVLSLFTFSLFSRRPPLTCRVSCSLFIHVLSLLSSPSSHMSCLLFSLYSRSPSSLVALLSHVVSLVLSSFTFFLFSRRPPLTCRVSCSLFIHVLPLLSSPSSHMSCLLFSLHSRSSSSLVALLSHVVSLVLSSFTFFLFSRRPPLTCRVSCSLFIHVLPLLSSPSSHMSCLLFSLYSRSPSSLVALLSHVVSLVLSSFTFFLFSRRPPLTCRVSCSLFIHVLPLLSSPSSHMSCLLFSLHSRSSSSLVAVLSHVVSLVLSSFTFSLFSRRPPLTCRVSCSLFIHVLPLLSSPSSHMSCLLFSLHSRSSSSLVALLSHVVSLVLSSFTFFLFSRRPPLTCRVSCSLFIHVLPLLSSPSSHMSCLLFSLHSRSPSSLVALLSHVVSLVLSSFTFFLFSRRPPLTCRVSCSLFIHVLPLLSSPSSHMSCLLFSLYSRSLSSLVALLSHVVSLVLSSFTFSLFSRRPPLTCRVSCSLFIHVLSLLSSPSSHMSCLLFSLHSRSLSSLVALLSHVVSLVLSSFTFSLFSRRPPLTCRVSCSIFIHVLPLLSSPSSHMSCLLFSLHSRSPSSLVALLSHVVSLVLSSFTFFLFSRRPPLTCRVSCSLFIHVLPLLSSPSSHMSCLLFSLHSRSSSSLVALLSHVVSLVLSSFTFFLFSRRPPLTCRVSCSIFIHVLPLLSSPSSHMSCLLFSLHSRSPSSLVALLSHVVSLVLSSFTFFLFSRRPPLTCRVSCSLFIHVLPLLSSPSSHMSCLLFSLYSRSLSSLVALLSHVVSLVLSSFTFFLFSRRPPLTCRVSCSLFIHVLPLLSSPSSHMSCLLFSLHSRSPSSLVALLSHVVSLVLSSFTFSLFSRRPPLTCRVSCSLFIHVLPLLSSPSSHMSCLLFSLHSRSLSSLVALLSHVVSLVLSSFTFSLFSRRPPLTCRVSCSLFIHVLPLLSSPSSHMSCLLFSLHSRSPSSLVALLSHVVSLVLSLFTFSLFSRRPPLTCRVSCSLFIHVLPLLSSPSSHMSCLLFSLYSRSSSSLVALLSHVVSLVLSLFTFFLFSRRPPLTCRVSCSLFIHVLPLLSSPSSHMSCLLFSLHSRSSSSLVALLSHVVSLVLSLFTFSLLSSPSSHMSCLLFSLYSRSPSSLVALLSHVVSLVLSSFTFFLFSRRPPLTCRVSCSLFIHVLPLLSSPSSHMSCLLFSLHSRSSSSLVALLSHVVSLVLSLFTFSLFSRRPPLTCRVSCSLFIHVLPLLSSPSSHMSCLLFSLHSRSSSSLVALLSHVVSLVLSSFTFFLFSRRRPLTCRVSCSLFIHVLPLLSSPSSHMSCLLFSLYSRSPSSLVALLSHVVSLVLSSFTFSLFSRRPPLTCRVSCSLFIHVLPLLSSPSSHMSCLLFSLYSRSLSSLVALLSHVVSLVLSSFTFSLFSRRPPLTCRVSCSLFIHVLPLLSSPSSHMSCLLFSLYSRSLSSLVALLSHVVSLVLSSFTFFLFSRRPPLTCRVSCSLFIHVLPLLSSPSSHMSCLLFSLYSRSLSSLVALLSHVVSLVLSLFTFSLFSRRPPLTCRVSCSLFIHVLSLLSSPSSHMSCLLFSLHSRSSSSLVALLSHVVSLVLSLFTFSLFSRRPPLTCRVSCSLFIHVLPLLSSPSSHMSCLLFSLYSRSPSSLVALLSHVVSLVLSLFTFSLFSRRPPLTCRVSCSLFIHVLPLLSSPSSHMSCLLFSLYSRSPSSLVALLSHVVSLVLSSFTFFLFSRRPPLTCRVSCSLFIHVLSLLSSPSSHMSCLLFSLHSRSSSSLVALLSHVVSLVLSSFTFFLFSRRPPLTCRVSCSLFIHVLPLLSSPSSHMSCLLFSLHSRSLSSLVALLSHVVSLVLSLFTFFLFSRRPLLTCRVSCSLFIHVLPLLSSPSSHMSCLLFSLYSRSPSSLVALLSHVVSLVLSLFTFSLFSRRPPLTCRVSCSLFIHVLPLLSSPSSHMSCLLFSLYSRSPSSLVALLSHVVSLVLSLFTFSLFSRRPPLTCRVSCSLFIHVLPLLSSPSSHMSCLLFSLHSRSPSSLVALLSHVVSLVLSSFTFFLFSRRPPLTCRVSCSLFIHVLPLLSSPSSHMSCLLFSLHSRSSSSLVALLSHVVSLVLSSFTFSLFSRRPPLTCRVSCSLFIHVLSLLSSPSSHMSCLLFSLHSRSPSSLVALLSHVVSLVLSLFTFSLFSRRPPLTCRVSCSLFIHVLSLLYIIPCLPPLPIFFALPTLVLSPVVSL